MLEAIRAHAQGWIAKIILGLIVLSFAIWGVDWYFQGGGQAAAVASVNDTDITQDEFVLALKNQKESLEQNTGAKVDLDDKGFRKEVLDELVNITLLADAAQRTGMRVTDAQTMAMLASIPVFQVEGKFSEEKLAAWLRNRGMSREALLGMLNQDLLLRQVQFGYGEGALVAAPSAALMAARLNQRREVNEVIFDSQQYLPTVNIDDKAVAADYQAHQQDYAMPAMVRLQFLALNAEAIMGQVNVTAEAVKQAYENNKARYQTPEQRRASHILIKVEEGASPEQRKAAKADADKLYQELVKTPARFAELAKQRSMDPGSAQRGGDLGSFTRDMMVKPFADAVYGMKVGELRPPVETQFGYHIIRLDGITPGAAVPFEQVAGEIGDELRGKEAQRKFAEAAERFSNLVYEQPDSLEPAAKEFQLKVAESGWISREQAQPPFLASPKLMDAVFAPEALEKKQNTEAVEVNPGLLVAARVLEHKPAGTRPLAEVAPMIRLKLTHQAARDKAIAAGAAALKAAQAGQPVNGLSAVMSLSRMRPLNLPPEAVKAIFKANPGKLPAYVGVETREGYRLYRINAVHDGEANPDHEKMIRRDLTRMIGQEELRAYLEYLRANAKIKVDEAALDKSAQ